MIQGNQKVQAGKIEGKGIQQVSNEDVFKALVAQGIQKKKLEANRSAVREMVNFAKIINPKMTAEQLAASLSDGVDQLNNTQAVGKKRGSGETKKFHIRDLLSAVTGRMLSKDVDNLYSLANHVMGEDYYTVGLYMEGLPAAAKHLEKQFPWLSQLKEIPAKFNPGKDASPKDWMKAVDAWSAEIAKEHLGGAKNVYLNVKSAV